MNLLLLRPEERAPTISLAGRRATHLREVLRVGPESQVRCAVLGDGEWTATVTAVRSDAVELQLTERLPPRPLPELHLLLALPRPKALARALQAAAALGASTVTLTNAWKVDKGYFSSPKLDPAYLEEQLWLGAEQGAIPALPGLHVHTTFREALPWVEELMARPHTRGALFHPRDSAPIPFGHSEARALLAIGPDGGWSERELASLEERGLLRHSLTRGVLRTEHAVVAALAQWELTRAEPIGS